jgi:hypothetical protein
MLILWRTLLFAALWLAFEAVISWAALCQHQNEYSSADQTTESYECVFKGPVASVARWFAEWWVRTFDKADAYVALFTFVLAVGTLALWRSTRNLWIATRDTAKRQERDTEILQRAYISVKPLGIHPFISEDGTSSTEIVGHVNIVNVGRLPAHIWFSPDQPFINWSPSDNLKEADLPCEEDVFVGVLGPAGEMPVGTGSWPKDCIGKQGYFYVWGRVDYLDGFGRERFTKFCHRYPSIPYDLSADGSKSIAVKHARYHQHGNDAD